MAGYYPWYTRATDIVHRLTVVGLAGFTVYMTANVAYTIYNTGQRNERRLTEAEQQQAQVASAEAVARAQEIAKGN